MTAALKISPSLQPKANVPLLAKAMLEGKSMGFHDLQGHNHFGQIMGVRPEGGKGLWLVATRQGEWCVRCQDGDFATLSQWAV